MAKHTRDELKQMQSLPLNIKIKMTQQRIRDWYNYWGGDVYQGFSGGKDSTVMKHIIDGMGYDVPAVFVNTGLEYPEIQQFVRDIKDGKYDCFNSNVEIIRPKMRFDEVVKNVGYPVISKSISHNIAIAKRKPNGNVAKKIVFDENSKSKYSAYRYRMLVDAPFNVSARCCDIIKKKPSFEYEKITGRKPYLATMAEESLLRTQNWIQNGCNAFENKRPLSNPISFWTEQDVLRYIKEYNVPYASVYGDIVFINSDGQEQYALCDNGQKLCTTGCNRTGCMFCMYGLHLEKSPNRFERMKITHPKQYEYCMKPVSDGGLGIKDVIDWMNENGNLNIKY